MTEPLTLSGVAQVCHEANRAYRAAVGQQPGPSWDEAGEDMQRSSIHGVMAAIDGATAQELHESWADERINAGWTYGEVKDADAKTHPCLVPYDQLPAEDRLKDSLFGAIVSALS